jgi:hypothetical protein
MILEYEIMKFDGDLGRPNLFVPLCKDLPLDKSLLKVFPSQARKQWFNEEMFWRLLRLWGTQRFFDEPGIKSRRSDIVRTHDINHRSPDETR